MKERGLIILAIAVLYQAARMNAGTPSNAGDNLTAAENMVKEAEARGLVSFKEEA